MHAIGRLAILLMLLSHPARAALELETLPAWGGRMVAGRDTELGLRLLSDRAGPFTLELTAEGFSLRHGGRLASDIPLRLWLPVLPDRNGALTLRLREGDGDVLTRELRFPPRSRPFPVRGTAAGLPRTVAGYGPVSTLTLHPDTLAGLDAPQAEALSYYLGGCGRLSLPGANPALLDGLRAMAGCGGRHVVGDGTPATTPPPLPVPQQLQPLGGDEPGPALQLAAFFTVYLLLLWAACGTLHRRPLLLLAPPLAGLGLAVAAVALPPRTEALVLVESADGAPQGRLAALLRVTGSRRHPARLPLIAGMGLPRALDGQPVQLVQEDGAAWRQLEVETPFLASTTIAVNGVLPLASRAAVTGTGSGPQLENRGRLPLPAGLLGAGGRLFATPPLSPGEHWSPEPDTPPAPGGAAARLLRAQAGDRTAWLLPLPTADTAPLAGYDRVKGWLLVTGIAGQTP